MAWGFIGNLLSSIASVFWKKSLGDYDLPQIIFSFFGEFGGLIIALILLFFVEFDFHIFLDRKLVLSIVAIIGVVYAYDYFDQIVYKKNTLSSLLPYQNLNSVLAIIAGYLLFKDASLIAVGVAIFIVIITVFSSLDYKNLSFPKNFHFIMISQVLMTLETLITGYFLKTVSDSDYFIVYEFIVVTIYLVPIFFRKEYKLVRHASGLFFRDRFISAFSGNISFLIYLFMVGQFGIVLSILFGFLGDGLTLLFSFIFLKEKPRRKDIILLIIVSLLVCVGFYFNQ